MSNKKRQIEPSADRLLTPGLELPKGRRGLLTWKWAERRLKRRLTFCIATVRKDGRPHVMVIWGLWFNCVMYFSTGPQSQKAANLERNHNCVICTDQDGEAVIMEAVARTVSVRGKNAGGEASAIHLFGSCAAGNLVACVNVASGAGENLCGAGVGSDLASSHGSPGAISQMIS